MPRKDPHSSAKLAAEIQQSHDNLDSPYNPAAEPTNEAAVAASTWELLRRNTAFKRIVRRWVSSSSFRRGHVLKADYNDNHEARCALDWMLTPYKRLELARFQIQKLRWKRTLWMNFGPILCEQTIPTAFVTRENITQALPLKPLPDAPPPITVLQSWNALPEQFRKQFRSAIISPVAAFESITDAVGQAADRIGIIGRRLAKGPPFQQLEGMAHWLVELSCELSHWATNDRIYRFRRGPHSRKKIESYLQRIRDDFTGPDAILPETKYNRHRSYLGTREDWHWFLEAEQRALNVHKSADLYTLAELYCHDVRYRALRHQAPASAEVHGFTGTPFKSKEIKARRTAVKRHVLVIQKWIGAVYPRPHHTSTMLLA